jgi:hypothetical protein
VKKVGILVGREKTFPVSLIESINERGAGDVTAEFVKVGGVRHDAEKYYDLIIDRISHEVPFYRAFLKRAALEGTIVINNPFWWSADDKFFNYSLAEKLGVATPRTVLLPQKEYIEGITGESLRNLEFPLDWEGIADYVGFPAIIKPFDGGGWKNVSRVNSLQELWKVYDTTGTLCMTLQEMIDWDQFVRCYCVGQRDVMIMPYDPRQPYLSGEQYLHNPGYLSAELADRVGRDVRTLCTALGYDINTVEFAIKDGIPYAIDFMNPAPDAEVASVGEFYHRWLVDNVTDMVFRRLEEARPTALYRWDALLSPAPGQAEGATVAEAASAAVAGAGDATRQATESIVPQPVRDLTSGVASTVGQVVGQAADVLSGVVSAVTEAAAPAAEETAAPKAEKKSSTKSRATSSSSATASKKSSTKKSAATGRGKKQDPDA